MLKRKCKIREDKEVLFIDTVSCCDRTTSLMNKRVRSTDVVILKRKTEVLGEISVPIPLCSPHIPHGLARDRAVCPQRKRRIVHNPLKGKCIYNIYYSPGACHKF